jgi:hypothetical protein
MLAPASWRASLANHLVGFKLGEHRLLVLEACQAPVVANRMVDYFTLGVDNPPSG